ncbi:germ cell nuclear acidic protein [Tenrec ecaudatus]|uniref:germ cell nuclear acidic protein n=1 Tax=Tenrec ecaudatus TaxID=94439 RepID=UPI003F59DFC2
MEGEVERNEAERLPCLPDDDDGSDLSSPVLDEGDSYDASQRSSNDTELGECAISQHNVSDDLGEQSLGESLRQLPSAAQPKPKSTHEKLPAEDEPAPVEEKPRKKTAKTKHIELPPGKTNEIVKILYTNNFCIEMLIGARFALCQLLDGTSFQSSSKLFTLSVPTGSQKCVPSKKIPSSAKVEKFQTGNSLCKIPGCFLLDLEKSKQYSGKKFQKNKDELVQKIYNLFNSSVFDKKLPKKIDIAWNKKMLKTAGICTTGEIKHPKKQRYAKIEIAQKVCDSADRLRDTLVHEICHVASWLLDGTRDSHGDAWNYYAHKSTMIHPELPKITRYHNYTINYRIHYECIQCKTRIGRYTRSLNTDRFICANCRGSLVLLPLTRKDGTPIEPYVRPFAKYVQENYRLVKQELGGKGHGDVMKKLSKDYIASKQKQGC